MKRFATILTAAALIAGSAQIASAERRAPEVTRAAPVIVEVPATQVLSPKDLHRRGLSNDAVVEVTKIPQGPEVRRGRG